jgi:hypothetical protein
MTDSKIVVDADLGRVDSKAKKTRGEVEQVGKAFNKWGSEITSAALRLGSVVRAITAIGDEIEKNQNKAIGASKTAGGGALERGRALRQLGLGDGPGGVAAADAAIRGLAGGATLDERGAFLGQLAAAQKSSKHQFKREDLVRAINLHSEGITSGEEIIKALTTGKLDKLIAENAQRRSTLSQTERNELDDRNFEREQQLVEEGAATSGRGRALRRASAIRDARDAQNPGAAAVRNVIGQVTGQDAFIRSGELALLVDMNENLSAIRTGVMKTANGVPSIGTTPEGGP